MAAVCAVGAAAPTETGTPDRSSRPGNAFGGGRTLVLDESAYLRYYVQFGMDRLDPEALKRDGEKVLGQKGLARLERMVRRWQRPPFAPAASPASADRAGLDWRDNAPFWVTQVANVGCNDERISFRVGTP